MTEALRTSADEVVALVGSTGRGRQELLSWKPKRQHVTKAVMAHTTAVAYTLRSADVLVLTTEHPLGSIRPEAGYEVKEIQDWRPDFAFSHLFHFCLEASGGIFSYEQFREYCRNDPAHEQITVPAEQEAA